MTALSKHVSVTILATWLVFSTVLLPTNVAYATSKKSHTDQGKHLGQEKKYEHETNIPEVENTSGQPAISAPVTHASTTTAVPQSHSDPAGNNGTVKIDRTPFDNHPDNQPHVTCSFQVDFYGFDAGVGDATVNFALHSPTRNGSLAVTSGDLTPHIGHDAAGGGTDLDASETYTLAFTGTPHSKQGYHVKLTVHAPGSQGNDTKHKVFWVEGCHEEETPPTVPGNGGGQILGGSASTTRAADLPARLPSTGMGILPMLATLTAMVLAYGTTYSYQLLRKPRHIGVDLEA